MKYYKVCRGYGDDYISIDETELEKAIHAHITGKVAVFKGGSISGNSITMIAPDYHRAMRWNIGYKLGPDDYAELSEKGIDRSHMTFLAETKENVHMLMQSGRTGLIGKPKEERKLIGNV